MSFIARTIDSFAASGRLKRFRDRTAPGLFTSLLLHAITLALLISWIHKSTAPTTPDIRIVPVEMVQLGSETVSPPSVNRSLVPQEQTRARLAPRNVPPPVGVSPKAKPPPDDLQQQLKALSQLKQPQSDPRLMTQEGVSQFESSSSDAAPGDHAAYALRDYVRAQIARRWNLDLAMLGNRKFAIALHIVMKRDGTLSRIEIADQARMRDDPVFRYVAISARNAATLSSPIHLPPGDYQASTDMTLTLDPRAALR